MSASINFRSSDSNKFLIMSDAWDWRGRNRVRGLSEARELLLGDGGNKVLSKAGHVMRFIVLLLI